ncbi:MAG: hypothetical protein UT85_C0032G0001 [Candidatus Levybacteria bacterium GW2011_GWA2_40_16]|nr:MAG: hypothetical protein UT85_C0032G0001 [Candidatus Levybacteria bacterium GW2011_GWA2_40_16]
MKLMILPKRLKSCVKKRKRNKMKFVNCCSFAALISFGLFILTFTLDSQAQVMVNDKYRIEYGNFNSIAGKSTGGGKTLTMTSGQNAIGLYTGSNYKVKAGFQYIYSIIPFSFSISSTSINFGVLNPGEPITRTNNLTVSNGTAGGYQVTASEDHPLRVLSTGVDIPNTTCDGGTCTDSVSAAWTSPLTYGFGYRCDNVTGTDCASGFSDSTYYKQFSASPSAQIVMSGTNVGRSQETQITYKVNISATQPAGSYQNVIMYIATPTI